jgi:hypothetical protein
MSVRLVFSDPHADFGVSGQHSRSRVDAVGKLRNTETVARATTVRVKGVTMRIAILSLAMMILAGVAAAADDGPFNGKWQVQQNIAGNESTQLCTFAQKGAELTGTCGSEERKFTVAGKVEDKKVSWSYQVEYNGSPLTLKYTGTIDAENKITGTVLVEEYSVAGDFTGTKAP